jgi:hypothetical protein
MSMLTLVTIVAVVVATTNVDDDANIDTTIDTNVDSSQLNATSPPVTLQRTRSKRTDRTALHSYPIILLYPNPISLYMYKVIEVH